MICFWFSFWQGKMDISAAAATTVTAAGPGPVECVAIATAIPNETKKRKLLAASSSVQLTRKKLRMAKEFSCDFEEFIDHQEDEAVRIICKLRRSIAHIRRVHLNYVETLLANFISGRPSADFVMHENCPSHKQLAESPNMILHHYEIPSVEYDIVGHYNTMLQHVLEYSFFLVSNSVILPCLHCSYFSNNVPIYVFHHDFTNNQVYGTFYNGSENIITLKTWAARLLWHSEQFNDSILTWIPEEVLTDVLELVQSPNIMKQPYEKVLDSENESE